MRPWLLRKQQKGGQLETQTGLVTPSCRAGLGQYHLKLYEGQINFHKTGKCCIITRQPVLWISFLKPFLNNYFILDSFDL